MFKNLFRSQSRHQKLAEKYRPQVAEILALDEEFSQLSDQEIKQRVVQHQGKSPAELKKVKTEIFAGVREAAWRTLEMKHFDVQLLGGLGLLDNNIAEMKTGEGKTLVATLPLTLYGLTGKGAHLVTVNDYLATRDADWMTPVYEFFDLTVGKVVPGMSPQEKREAYACDITYGTNNEFGFDYLRDNMAQSLEQLTQRPLNYAIVDEVDSILIDEARTPLIISAPDAESTKQYQRFSKLVPQLQENRDYNVDEKRRSATLTDDGIATVEKMLGLNNLYAEGGIRLVHYLEQALRARTLYQKDKDYVVREGQVIIVDEFTGRLMEGRRYSEGLHQAIEAKEGVVVQQESKTLATITFQNFFRLYDHLAGMTGTAVTSAEEFEKVYNLDVVEIPTNKEIARNDKTDRIFLTEAAKIKAISEEVKQRHEKGQPVLVGTVAIEKSELLSQHLQQKGVPHNVLNAKHHDKEAEIVSQAGQKGAVTISTNMAGRGTDIKLGNGVANLGGLFVLGTERHEARRIDNQLRGRSGRQGDPGETQFFVSLDDDVMRIFGGDRMKSLMERLKVPEDEPIENKLVSRAIAGAQERVEGFYFDSRKQVLSYDDVLNRQRTAVYTLRRAILENGTWKEKDKEEETLPEYVEDLINRFSASIANTHYEDVKELAEIINSLTGIETSTTQSSLESAKAETEKNGPEAIIGKLTELVTEALEKNWKQKVENLGEEDTKKLLTAATLRAIDTHWMEQLDTMDHLRTGIGLRGYGQRDPLVEYQKEGYALFERMMESIENTIIETVFRAEVVRQDQYQGQAVHAQAARPGETEPAQPETPQTIKSEDGPGRNDPCPCGSGKKYKKCGMINAPEHKT